MNNTNNPLDRSLRTSHQGNKSRYWKYVCFAIVILALAVPFVAPGGIRNSWWVLLLLICPLSMFFMMGRNDHSSETKRKDNI